MLLVPCSQTRRPHREVVCCTHTNRMQTPPINRPTTRFLPMQQLTTNVSGMASSPSNRYMLGHHQCSYEYTLASLCPCPLSLSFSLLYEQQQEAALWTSMKLLYGPQQEAASWTAARGCFMNRGERLLHGLQRDCCIL